MSSIQTSGFGSVAKDILNSDSSVSGITTQVTTLTAFVASLSGPTSSRPSSPVAGQTYYDTTLSQTLVWTGSAWIQIAITTIALTGTVSNNLVAVRTVTPSFTNVSKTGIVNLSSDTGTNPTTRGASGNYATISGGDRNTASGDYSTVVGGFLCTASGNNSIVGGNEALATNESGIAFGSTAQALADNCTSIGPYAVCTTDSGTAIGFGSLAQAEDATAIGTYANSGGISSVAIGDSSYAATDYSVCIGNGAESFNPYGVSIGFQSQTQQATNTEPSLAVGYGAYASDGGIAIGSFADAEFFGSTALGVGSLTRQNCHFVCSTAECNSGTFGYTQASTISLVGMNVTTENFKLQTSSLSDDFGGTLTPQDIYVGYTAQGDSTDFRSITGTFTVHVQGTLSATTRHRVFFIRVMALVASSFTTILTVIDSVSGGDSQASTWTATVTAVSTRLVLTISGASSGATNMIGAARFDFVEH